MLMSIKWGVNMIDNSIKVYILRDEKGSIIQLQSSIFLENIEGWEFVDEWTKEQDRYIYAHADNGEYFMLKHGTTLYDELGRPNYHDDFLLWTDEEKEKLYPISQEDDSIDELEELKERQLILENALQDMILMTMKGGDE